MTPNNDHFVRIIQVGIASGFNTLKDCYGNYILSLKKIFDKPNLEKEIIKTQHIFAKFYRDCVSAPEEEIKLREMNDIQVVDYFHSKEYKNDE